jgi:hypothetical protein
MKRRIVIGLAAVAVACGGSEVTGSITGAVLADGKIVATVKLDDGRDVRAEVPAASGRPTALTGGQRVQVEQVPNSTVWRIVRTLDAAAPTPARPVEVTVASIARQSKWNPPDAITKMVLVRGVSSTFVNGSMQGFEAEPDYEIAIVALEIALNTTDGALPLDDLVALDAAGKEYQNLGEPKPLSLLTKGQRREFAFVVPAGTALVTLRFSNGYTQPLGRG